MCNKDNNMLSFTQEEIDEIMREEAREKAMQLMTDSEPYELSLYVSDYDRVLHELPLEAEMEYCVPGRNKV